MADAVCAWKAAQTVSGSRVAGKASSRPVGDSRHAQQRVLIPMLQTQQAHLLAQLLDELEAQAAPRALVAVHCNNKAGARVDMR